jgi:hypothetical protein
VYGDNSSNESHPYRPKAEAIKQAVPAAKGTVGNLVFKQLKNDSGVVLRPGKK